MFSFGIMVFVSIIFTVLGICFWISKTPVGFWTGQEVKEDEITDVKACKCFLFAITGSTGSTAVTGENEWEGDTILEGEPA